MISGELVKKQEQDEKTKEIIAEIDKRRAVRLRKLLPRWYLTYRRFRFLLVSLIGTFTFLAFTSLPILGEVSSTNLIFALIFVYLVVVFADRTVAYFAFRRVPIEVYYQEENHY